MTDSKINAAGLSRVYTHWQNNYCGTISAFRNYKLEAYRRFFDNKTGEFVVPGLKIDLTKYKKEDEKKIALKEATLEYIGKHYGISKAENKSRHRELGRLLRKYDFKFIEMIGGYTEAGAKSLEEELSYFVFSDKPFLKDLMKLGNMYEQDSIGYCDKPGGDFKLIVTKPKETMIAGEKYGATIMEFPGGMTFGKVGGRSYYSRLGNRRFYFGFLGYAGQLPKESRAELEERWETTFDDNDLVPYKDSDITVPRTEQKERGFKGLGTLNIKKSYYRPYVNSAEFLAEDRLKGVNLQTVKSMCHKPGFSLSKYIQSKCFDGSTDSGCGYIPVSPIVKFYTHIPVRTKHLGKKINSMEAYFDSNNTLNLVGWGDENINMLLKIDGAKVSENTIRNVCKVVSASDRIRALKIEQEARR